MPYPGLPRPSPRRAASAAAVRRFARLLSVALFMPLAAHPARAAEAPAEIPACPLLTTAEVGAAFGGTVEAAEQDPLGGGAGRGRQTTCFWTPVGGALGATVSLAVWSWPPGHPGAAGTMDAVRGVADPGRPPPETVALGDDAVWDGDRLHVRLGSVVLTLAASRNALDVQPDALPALEALAGKALERLP